VALLWLGKKKKLLQKKARCHLPCASLLCRVERKGRPVTEFRERGRGVRYGPRYGPEPTSVRGTRWADAA
jgi:hypothetical protein